MSSRLAITVSMRAGGLERFVSELDVKLQCSGSVASVCASAPSFKV